MTPPATLTEVAEERSSPSRFELDSPPSSSGDIARLEGLVSPRPSQLEPEPQTVSRFASSSYLNFDLPSMLYPFQPPHPSLGPHFASGRRPLTSFSSALPDLNHLSGQWTPIGAPDFGPSASIDLNEIDLRFLDAYNANVPFELGSTPPDESIERPLTLDPCQPAAIGTEAFKNFYWTFRPTAQDHGAAEEHNLFLPSTRTDHESPESRVSLKRRTTCRRLSVAARDKILTVVMRNCRSENVSRAAASFPSIELLDTLLQYYLTSPVARPDSFLHTATFDPNEKRPELLAAMAACGAVLTSDPALSKLGFAIQECVRMAVYQHVRDI